MERIPVGREANFEGHDKDKSLQAPYFTVEEERMSSLRNHNTYICILWVRPGRKANLTVVPILT